MRLATIPDRGRAGRTASRASEAGEGDSMAKRDLQVWSAKMEPCPNVESGVLFISQDCNVGIDHMWGISLVDIRCSPVVFWRSGCKRGLAELKDAWKACTDGRQWATLFAPRWWYPHPQPHDSIPCCCTVNLPEETTVQHTHHTARKWGGLRQSDGMTGPERSVLLSRVSHLAVGWHMQGEAPILSFLW